MRHFYFRMFLGVIFLACAVYSFITGSAQSALFYAAFGGGFLYSGYAMKKKNQNDKRRKR